MKKRIVLSNKILVGIVVVLLILFSLCLEIETVTVPCNVNKTNMLFEDKLEILYSFDYTPHAPIDIDSDDDFITYSFPGTGIKTDPYIIENYEIIATDSEGIYIYNTSKFFIIRDCFIDTADDITIYINKVASGTALITNNTCIEQITISSSTNAVISNNHIVNYGVHLAGSNHSLVTNNTCKFVTAYNTAEFNNITYNSIVGHSNYGVSLKNLEVKHTIIHHNTITDTGQLPHCNSQALDNGENNTWYDVETNEGNEWSDWSGGPYLIDGSAGTVDPYPLGEPVVAEYSHIILLTLFLPLVILFFPRIISKKKRNN